MNAALLMVTGTFNRLERSPTVTLYVSVVSVTALRYTPGIRGRLSRTSSLFLAADAAFDNLAIALFSLTKKMTKTDGITTVLDGGLSSVTNPSNFAHLD
jgi:hypothetical protein